VRCVCVALVLAAGATVRAAPIVLAKTGNMPTVCERAEYLMALDPRYAAFASRLPRLADGYQSRAIAALVEKHRTERYAQ
jgi:hypothetical protein